MKQGAFIQRAAVLALLLLLPGMAGAAQQGFNLGLLHPIIFDKSQPPAKRLDQGLAYLKGELAHPSPTVWGIAGGPIDTGYVQAQIVGTLAFPGSEVPRLLRQRRDGAKDPRLKKLLTVALGLTGAQDTFADLLQVARTDRHAAIRNTAMRAVTDLFRKPLPTDIPRRLRPGETWAPPTAAQKKAAVALFLFALRDPYVSYLGLNEKVGKAVYPVREEAASSLGQLGYTVERTPTGWLVTEKGGKVVHRITLTGK
jgi:hypothetical protein